MDAAELKILWETSVQRLLQSPTYRGTKHWNPIFQTVSEFLNNNQEIDAIKFVEVNIKHMISAGLVEKLFPNVLSGEGALARYLTAPNDVSTEDEALVSLRAQAECFSAVCKYMGEDFAFEGAVTRYTPLFMAYMRWKTNRQVSDVLKGNAQTELIYKASVRKFFPAEFLEYLA